MSQRNMIANMLDIVQVILYIEFLASKIFSQQGTGFCISFIHKDHPVGRILFYAAIYLCPYLAIVGSLTP
jgi:hypothetical protein